MKAKITCGVYKILHVSGAEYIGGSTFVEKRWSTHRARLRIGQHPSKKMQELWNTTSEDEWQVVIIEECPSDQIREIEQKYIDASANLLNNNASSRAIGRVVSQETKDKIGAKARARLAADPAQREAIAARARALHAEGRLGPKTWTDGPRRDTPAVLASRAENSRKFGEYALEHNTSEVMSERSYMRKNIRRPEDAEIPAVPPAPAD